MESSFLSKKICVKSKYGLKYIGYVQSSDSEVLSLTKVTVINLDKSKSTFSSVALSANHIEDFWTLKPKGKLQKNPNPSLKQLFAEDFQFQAIPKTETKAEPVYRKSASFFDNLHNKPQVFPNNPETFNP